MALKPTTTVSISSPDRKSATRDDLDENCRQTRRNRVGQESVQRKRRRRGEAKHIWLTSKFNRSKLKHNTPLGELLKPEEVSLKGRTDPMDMGLVDPHTE